MGYKIRLPLPPPWNHPQSVADLESKLGVPAGTVKDYGVDNGFITIEAADGFTPTALQKTTIKTNIKALYDPDIP